MSSTTADYTSAIREKFPQVTPRPSLDHEAIDVPTADLLGVLRTLRDEHGFDMLLDLTAIDWAEGASPRFVAVYHLYASVNHVYIRVASACTGDDDAPAVPSVTGLWPAANWHERETYDMFGITFAGHPDLRRILMWEGYPYYPLRKEFPLAGIETELPDPEVAAETGVRAIPAPMAGGPFVASSGEMNLTEAEPRAKDESWNESSEKPGN
jgi:NADH-quinone oxidoreductase subunit C